MDDYTVYLKEEEGIRENEGEVELRRGPYRNEKKKKKKKKIKSTNPSRTNILSFRFHSNSNIRFLNWLKQNENS